MVVKNAAPWAGGAISGTLNLVAILVLLGLAYFTHPPRAAVVAYLGGVLLLALGEGAYRTWAKADDDLKLANRKLEAEHSREGLAERLDGLAREAELLMTEVPGEDLSPNDLLAAEYALVEELNDVNRRGLRELRLYAPEFLDRFKEDAPGLDQHSFSSSPVPGGYFEKWINWTARQLREISAKLRNGD